MKNTCASLAVALAAVFASINPAQATVIDFNGLSGAPYPGGYAAYGGLYTYIEGPVSLQGFTFVPTNPYPYQYFAGDLNALIFCYGWNDHCAANATDYLLSSATQSIRRSDGGVFKLNAFDLGNYVDDDDANPAQSSFLVEARRADGSTVSQIIMLDAIPNYASGPAGDLNHFTFTGFDNITSVNINLLTARKWTGMVLDNVDVTALGSAQVPEPASLALLGIGLVGLLRRRPRS